MATLDNSTTKNRILDQAEFTYATTGMTDFTLRTLTEQAGVNLASINYHFKSKQTLIEAMLYRVLNPFCDEQIGLLCRLKAVHGANLLPTHVLSASLLPLLREIRQKKTNDGGHRLNFLQRAAMDASPPIRGFIEQRFVATSLAFDEAFSQSAAHLSYQEAVWRARLFCNALPGSVNNGSVFAMSNDMLNRPEIHWSTLLVHLGAAIESVMTGTSDSAQVHHLICDMLDLLSSTSTLKALNTSNIDTLSEDREAHTVA